jgi:protein-S-isoprenylcysteine O-methyltransferase Ste14
MKPATSYIIKSSLRGIAGIALLAAGFVIVAGRYDYVQGWVLVGFYALIMPVMFCVLRDKQELNKERKKPGPGVKLWDRFLVQIIKLLMVGTFVVGILDTGRYLWSPRLPIWTYIAAYAAFATATAIPVWATAVNDFFSSHVRIQKDRGHRVVDTGPYAYVRHPGYAGMILAAPATALVLGSLWALIPGLIQIPVLILRTALEDKMLRRELTGYEAYAKRVRYRLVPKIW